MSKICYGCGVKLQYSNPSELGYVPEKKIDTSNYCMRCFRSIHYGKIEKNHEPKSTKYIIDNVNKHAKFACFMTGFIEISDEIMDLYHKLKVPKMLIISKSDIIPKNVSYSQIKNYLRVVYNVKENIIFTSNKTNMNTLLKSLYDKDEVYFLGMTNAGKSTLLNTLIEKYGTKTNKLTTSYKENTTQDFVRLKINNKTFIDSPGFAILNFEVDKLSNISNEIRPITYQNKDFCTYKIGNLLKINFKGNTSLIFYFSKNIKIDRLYKSDLEGTSFKVKENSDIVILGLGFIKTTRDVQIKIANDLLKYITIRSSIVGGSYE